MPNTNVADLRLKGPDALDDTILAFYGRRPPEYAVYRTGQRVLVHFADSARRAAEQRQAIARLNPLRGEINGLVDGWRTAPDGSHRRCRAERYDRRVGDALVLGFEGDLATAELLLKEIKEDILAERIARGRAEYLFTALGTVVVALVLIMIATLLDIPHPPGSMDLWGAAAAGSIGAFFSISLAMRSRTVLPDLERTANIMDAILRVIIGVMAAAVLMALMKADVVSIDFGVNNKMGTEEGWLAVLIIGFIAGFSERFVPDLLARASAATDRTQPSPAPTPPAAAPSAPAAGAVAAGATEGAEPEAAEEEDNLPEEAATDGCVTDVDLPEELVTTDVDLPAAAGGVETPERPEQPGGGT